MALSAPTPSADAHDLNDFACSESVLTAWLARQARRNEVGGASRTYVVADGTIVVGYYCLAAGGVAHSLAPGSVRRNMPEPVPAIVLGRLATKTGFEGQGIGSGMLKDAVLRARQAAGVVGARVLLCTAMTDEARTFYVERGFAVSPVDPMLLMLRLG